MGVKNFTALAKSIQKVYWLVVKLVLFGENQGKIPHFDLGIKLNASISMLTSRIRANSI